MIFRRNIAVSERVVRTLAGGLMIACGAFGFELGPLARGLMVAGAITILTGVFGLCPACAVVGRKLAGE